MLQNEIENLKRQLNKASQSGYEFEITNYREEITRYKQQISSLSLTIQQDASRYSQ